MSRLISLLKHIFLIITTLLLLRVSGQENNIPEPYGGMRELKELVRNEMVYPENSMKEDIKGKVLLRFTVDQKGVVSDISVINSVNAEIDKEAVRILKKILWTPATNLGRPAETTHTLEIEFNPKKYHSNCKSRGYTNLPYPEMPVDTSGIIYENTAGLVLSSPVFSSIDASMTSFINNHLQYPETAFKQNISGTVKLKFVIEPYGKISNLIVINSVGGGCNEEAIRLARLITWKPAVKDGKAVRSFNTLEITFDIAKKSVHDASGQGQVH